MQNKKCAGFGFFYEDDYIVRMPPLRSYTVRVKIKSIDKGTPRFVGLEDEVLDTMQIRGWDVGLLAELRLKASVGDEAFKDFEELVDQSALPVTFFDKIRWTLDDWVDWLMGR